MQREAAVNPVPWPALVIALAMIGIEVVLSIASFGLVGGPAGIGWRLNAVTDYAYSPVVFEQVILHGNWDPSLMKRFFTFLFIHGDLMSAIFGAAILLALGKFVGEVVGNLWLMALMLVSTLAGTLFYGAVLSGPQALFGIWPVDYGLIGAFTYLTWLRLKETGGNQLRAFRLIFVLLCLQLIFSLLFGTDKTWVAEIAGFVAGFALAVPAAPGGWNRLLERLRASGA